MKPHRYFILALMLISVAPIVATAEAKAPEGAENWNGAQVNWRDLPSGVREATVTRKPVIMVFHATWCTACKQYRKVFRDPEIVRATQDFVMILIDADKDKVANGAFAPDGTYVPRTLFLNAEGDIQSSIRGKDPEFPHTIDIKQPNELLSLMRKAKALLITGTVKDAALLR